MIIFLLQSSRTAAQNRSCLAFRSHRHLRHLGAPSQRLFLENRRKEVLLTHTILCRRRKHGSRTVLRHPARNLGSRRLLRILLKALLAPRSTVIYGHIREIALVFSAYHIGQIFPLLFDLGERGAAPFGEEGPRSLALLCLLFQ